MKTCSRCGETKPLTEFNVDNSRKDNRHPWCAICHRAYVKVQQAGVKRKRSPKYHFVQRLKKYGMTPNDYWDMLDEQDGECKICHAPYDDDAKLVVDHDHATGVVRGLLCNPCNLALGFLKDDPVLLERALLYLRAESPVTNTRVTSVSLGNQRLL